MIGGSGFLGKNLSLMLLKKGYNVIVVDKKKFDSKKIIFVKSNLKNLSKLKNYFKRSTFVFHLAGIASLEEALIKPVETVQQNILTTVKLLKMCVKHNVERFIYASSIYTISEQGGFYRVSKLACEQYIQEFYKRFKLDYTILRYGSLYGAGASKDNTIQKIISNFKKKNILLYNGNAKNIRSYINVNDASRATIKALKTKYKNKILLINGLKKIKVINLMNLIKKIVNSETKIIFKGNRDIGHYVKLPKKVVIQKGQKLTLKKYTPLEKGIRRLI